MLLSDTSIFLIFSELIIIDVNIIMIVAHPFDTFGTMEGGFPTAQPLGGVGRDYSSLMLPQNFFKTKKF
jgi:hypothetical protein